MKRVPLLEAVSDVSGGNRKILQSDFLQEGPLAVVDQGRSQIAGYTYDTSASVKTDGPVIVFGDHTRAIKFVDFPFAMGADGVKVLQVREGFDPKFVYHYLISRELPSAGYSRHFKFLKQVEVPRPRIEEQRRIAAILDHADDLRAKRREVLAHLDDLTQSTFRDMVGAAPQDELSAGELMPHMRNGVSPATNGQHLANVLTLSAVTRGRFDPGAVKEGRFVTDPPDDKRVRRTDFLMCRGNGNAALVGVGAFASEDRMDLVFPDTVIAGRVDTSKVLLPVLQMAWQQRDVRRQIEAASRTTNGTYKVNQKSLGAVRLRIPSMDVQVAFAAVAHRVQAQSTEVSAALMRDDELFASLQSRAFKGELW